MTIYYPVDMKANDFAKNCLNVKSVLSKTTVISFFWYISISAPLLSFEYNGQIFVNISVCFWI